MNSGHKSGPVRRGGAAALTPAAMVLAVLALAAGCGGGGGGSSATTNPPVVITPTPLPPIPVTPSVSAPVLSGLTATLSEDRADISVGGTVAYTFTLTNTSGGAQTITADTNGAVPAPNASLIVSSPTGRTVYPPSPQPGARPRGVPPPPPLGGGVVTLQPGQSIAQTRQVAAFGSAGTYQAVAAFTVAAAPAGTLQTVTLPALAVTAQ